MTLREYITNRLGELNRKDTRWAKLFVFNKWVLLIGKDI
jgi:hypothetical protein